MRRALRVIACSRLAGILAAIGRSASLAISREGRSRIAAAGLLRSSNLPRARFVGELAMYYGAVFAIL